MKNRLYIAYGSNLNREQMLRRCPDAVIVGTAVLKDHQMLFRKSGTGFYLTVEPKKGRCVPVGIWSVTSDDETRLDGYEGYPVCYYKKEVTLDVLNPKTGKSRRRHCFLYAMYANRPIGIPSQRYMETCRKGYRDFGFNLRTLNRAYLESGVI